jgi:Ca2+-binding RTX toxin-like protein
MAINAFFSQSLGVLTVFGDNANNTIALGQNAAGDLVVNDGAVQIFGGKARASDARHIFLVGFGGDDTLKIDESKGKITASTFFLGGDGNDTMIGGSAAELFYGGNGHDFVDGNGGDDTAFLGAGDDTFLWDPGDGSDRIEGGAGLDTMVFNGSNGDEIMDLSANGNRLKFFRNLGNIVMDTDDVERVDVNALGGKDKITINNLAVTDVREVNINLANLVSNGVGDTQIDQVIVNGTDEADTIAALTENNLYSITGLAANIKVSGSEATDALVINALGGNDKVDATTLAAAITSLTIDGGAGDDILFGGAGNDVMIGGAGNDFMNGRRGDDVAFMGAGDDVFEWNPGEGSDVVEGQDGLDKMLFNGANVGEIFDFSANGGRVKFFRNVANITMDLNDVEQVDLNALGGSDTVTINPLAGTDLTQINLNLAALGGSGDGQLDNVIVVGTNGEDTIATSANNNAISVTGLSANISIVGADNSDRLTLQTLDGNDVIEASPLPANLISLVADTGAGDDIFLGSAGNDVFLGGAGSDIALGGAGDDLLDGGAGDDVLIGNEGTDTFLNGEIEIQ